MSCAGSPERVAQTSIGSRVTVTRWRCADRPPDVILERRARSLCGARGRPWRSRSGVCCKVHQCGVRVGGQRDQEPVVVDSLHQCIDHGVDRVGTFDYAVGGDSRARAAPGDPITNPIGPRDNAVSASDWVSRPEPPSQRTATPPRRSATAAAASSSTSAITTLAPRCATAVAAAAPMPFPAPVITATRAVRSMDRT